MVYYFANQLDFFPRFLISNCQSTILFSTHCVRNDNEEKNNEIWRWLDMEISHTITYKTFFLSINQESPLKQLIFKALTINSHPENAPY